MAKKTEKPDALAALEKQVAELDLQIRKLATVSDLEPSTYGCTGGCTGDCPDPTGNCTYSCTSGCTNGCTQGCVDLTPVARQQSQPG